MNKSLIINNEALWNSKLRIFKYLSDLTNIDRKSRKKRLSSMYLILIFVMVN